MLKATYTQSTKHFKNISKTLYKLISPGKTVDFEIHIIKK